MKIRASFIIILLAALSAAITFCLSVTHQPKVTEAPVGPMDFDAAVKLLNDNKPAPPNVLTSALANPKETTNAATLKLAEEEMTAIAVIHRAHRKVDLKLLLPYIGFNSNPFRVFSLYIESPTRAAPRAVQEIEMTYRETWPMFAVVLDSPDATASLENYAENKRNPIQYRLDAFQVLQYLDKARLNTVAAKLRTEIADTPPTHAAEIAKWIDSVENGTSGFNGGMDTEHLSAL